MQFTNKSYPLSILCTKKNKKMVKYFLGDKTKNIFASKYQLYLPTEEELEEELKKEIKNIKHRYDINPGDKNHGKFLQR